MRFAGAVNSEAKARPIRYETLLALLLAGLMASLTFSIESFAAPAQIPFLGDFLPLLVALLFPGILGSMAIGGNAHAWSLWLAAFLNGLLFSGWAGSDAV